MLNTSKASTDALLNAAQSYFDRQKYQEAEPLVRELIKRNARDAAALALMAELSVARGHPNMAYYARAIAADPGQLSYQKRFLELGGGELIAREYQPDIDAALTACLESADKLDCSLLRQLWASHLQYIPAMKAGWDMSSLTWFSPENKEFFESRSDFKALLTPSVLLGIKTLLMPNPLIEELIKHIRKHLLEDHQLHKKLSPDESLMLTAAIAQYCFSTGHIIDCTPDEEKRVEILKINIETGKVSANEIALLSCYLPLYTLKNAANIQREFSSNADIGDIIQRQITDYDTLQKTAKEVVAITKVDDSVSLLVQKQYEDYPYPQWESAYITTALRNWKAAQINRDMAAELGKKQTKMLIAGCGTGCDATVLSIFFPSTEILAVDLSRSSLSYAINKAQELGIDSITFRQADILHLDKLGRKFDHIIAGGVLHHLKEPVKGWKILCDLLHPGGLMTIGLYSKYAHRNSIIKAQKAIKEGGYGRDTESMLRFRRNSPNILDRDTLLSIAALDDYYNLSMYRDLLFHEQEYNYDLPEIEEILDKLGLAFEGFIIPPAVSSLYGQMFPEDKKQVSLKNWHQFEEKNPATFKNMYRFWCRKKS